ncbi:MAG: type VI-D CRISPR-associated RNA-guided ribonuclease Cas13d [Oscillospiraceae bacterium]
MANILSQNELQKPSSCETQTARQENQASVSDEPDTAVSAKNDNGKKSMAKAAGVKSVFAVGETVYMTSFGKGNDAVLEKKIVDESPENINTDNPAYAITDISSVNYSVEGHRGQTVCATADNPLHHDGGSSVPTDMLCLKSALEKAFFGENCGEPFDDNLHIQLIYNILDIEKILAVYSTNAVYALNNMIADEDDESSDLFQNMTTDYTYDEFLGRSERIVKSFNAFVKNKRLAYYSDAFYEKKGKDNGKRSDKEIYSILAMLGKLRHWCVHSESGEAEYWLYKLDNLNSEFTDILDILYNRSVNEINRGFVETNKVNIQILQRVCKNTDPVSLVKAYYEFLITKKHKNKGFSIKLLREKMLAEIYNENPNHLVFDKRLNSVRNKLYQLIDFIICLGYQNEYSDRVDALVSSLRSSVTDEEKEAVYNAEAAYLLGRHKGAVELIAKSLNGANIKALRQNNPKISDSALQSCFIKPAERVSNFTKLIYLLTRFINGKEINDLLTTLINKFDNIRSFLETMEELGLERTFTENYRFFEDSKKYLEELVELNSFAKSCSFDISAKRIMYCDALDILGVRDDLSESMINDILQLDENGKRISKNQRKNGLRNFIASNVIDSNRFKYLVRYGNPKKIRETAKCTPAVKFVLDGIPDSQIERYYKSCFPHNNAESAADEKRKALAEMISNISFDWFKDAGKVQRVNSESRSHEAEIKRKNQAIIRLYLAVMYLMLKNLVNVNSRYVIAFHCVERDAKLYKLNGLAIEGNTDKNRTLLTAAIMGITSADRDPSGEIVADCDLSRAANAANRHLRKKYWYVKIFSNLKQADRNVINEFRNSVCHLNAIRNINTNIEGIGYVKNYFTLYHYLIQRHISSKKISLNSFSAEYISNLEKFHTPSKYFIKAYCTPFAYNLVRYKNLTVDGLFDRNAPLEK